MSSNPLTRTATFTALSRSLRLGLPLALGLTLAALLLWLCGAAPLVRAADLCVHPAGAGGCYTTIQAAVTAAAAAGDTINIAAGTYNENVIVGSKRLTFIGASADSTFVDGSNTGRVFSVTATSATFSDLTIQNGLVSGSDGGGIYAAGALALTNVNVLSNTASGLIGGGGVRVRGELQVTGGRFENNRVTNVSNDSEGGAIFSNAAVPPHPNVTISGATFISNTANYGGGISLAANLWLTNTQFISNSATTRGGGVFQNAAGTMTLSGGRFERNAAGASGRGGGLYFAGAAVVSGTEFISNTSGGTGGGARIGGTVTLTDATFTGNSTTGSSGHGGGLYAGAELTLTNGTFTGNSATGASSYGGGLYVASTATVAGTQFISNTSSLSGGGLYENGSSATVTVTGAEFISNTASGALTFSSASRDLAIPAEQVAQTKIMAVGGNGGGLYAAGPVALVDTRVMSNTAATSGGGLYAGRAATLTDTLFIDNTAANGGGLYSSGSAVGNCRVVNSVFGGNSATTNGAALYLTANSTGRTAAILHTTIGNPSLGAAQAIYVGGTSGVTTDITNTIVASHTVGIQQAAGTVTAWNTLFHGNTTDIGGTVTNNDPVVGDPLFVDPANADYHLGATSPAVDAGVDAGVTTDYDGDTRPQGLGYDIGYDEVLQQCGLSTGVDYLFASPTITLTFSNLGNVNCAAAIYFPRSHAHATGSVGNGVGADHFWQIVARDSSGATATGFTARLTAPIGGVANPALCDYTGTGTFGWDCTGSTNNGDGTMSRTVTHLSDWAMGNHVGPNAIRLARFAARGEAWGALRALLERLWRR